MPLFVAYYRRALPRFLKVKELIDGGAIGEVRYVTVLLSQRPVAEDIDPDNLPWRVLPEISGGGRFVDMGSHTLDFLDFVLGPIRSATGHAANTAGYYPAEDTVTASFEFDSGVLEAGIWNFTGHADADVCEIAGSLGKVSFSSFGAEPIVLETAAGRQSSPSRTRHTSSSRSSKRWSMSCSARAAPRRPGRPARTTWVMDQILRDG